MLILIHAEIVLAAVQVLNQILQWIVLMFVMVKLI